MSAELVALLDLLVDAAVYAADLFFNYLHVGFEYHYISLNLVNFFVYILKFTHHYLRECIYLLLKAFEVCHARQYTTPIAPQFWLW